MNLLWRPGIGGRGRGGRQRGRAPVRWLTRHRRLLAAVLLGCAATAAVRAVTATPQTRSVLVATDDLRAGDRVRAADVRVKNVPRDLVPAGALTREQLPATAQAASPVRSGEILTDARLAGAATLPEGTVAVPIQVAPDAAPWLSVGARVMFYPSGALEPVLTDRQALGVGAPTPIGPVRVVATRLAAEQVATTAGASQTTVLVEVDATNASQLAQAAASGSLWPALMP